jgi:hypothetical protein
VFKCLGVWVFGCLVVWLFGCLVVWLFKKLEVYGFKLGGGCGFFLKISTLFLEFSIIFAYAKAPFSHLFVSLQK